MIIHVISDYDEALQVDIMVGASYCSQPLHIAALPLKSLMVCPNFIPAT